MSRRDDVVQRVLAIRGWPAVRDAALLAVRVGLAWLFIYHGGGTLFGAFHGYGIHRMAEFFAVTAGLRPGTFFAVLNGITEFFGGIALGVGALSRLAAIGIFCDMVMAMITVTWRNGIVSSAAGSGYELNVALAALAVVIILMGAGRLSLDYLAGTWLAKRSPSARGAKTTALPASPSP